MLSHLIRPTGLIVLLLILACTESLPTSTPRAEFALSSMITRAENINEQLGDNLFTDVKLQQKDAQLVLTVSDLWYITPKHLQDREVDGWMGVWSATAGNSGWTGLARVQFLDKAGKQVAYKRRSIKR